MPVLAALCDRYVVVLCLSYFSSFSTTNTSFLTANTTMVRMEARKAYTMEAPLQFRWYKAGMQHYIPAELRKPYCGFCAGAKTKAKKLHFKPFLRLIILDNVNSVKSKCYELVALVKNVRTYHDCSLMYFTETWLNNIRDLCVDLTGFNMLRADWNCTACGQKKGGRLAPFVNNRWCNSNHITPKERICS